MQKGGGKYLLLSADEGQLLKSSFVFSTSEVNLSGLDFRTSATSALLISSNQQFLVFSSVLLYLAKMTEVN